MKLLASKLTKRIILQARITNSDDWYDVRELSAAISAISEMKLMGLEVFRSMQLMTSDPYLFTIRYLDDVNISMRILYGKRVFSIKRIINPDEQNVSLKIITEEEVL
jgi:SPP1 family predicted phage head-tail adaptor